MELKSFETSVTIKKSARYNIPEDLNFQQQCCDKTIRMYRHIIYFTQMFLSRALIPSYFPSFFAKSKIKYLRF
jgi:hypothetical protein